MIKIKNFNQIKNILSEVMRVEKETWPEEIRAPREKFESRAEIFPQGFQLGFVNNKLWGVSTAEIIDFNPKKPCTSWEKITDNGWIKKTHNPKGNALYVISVGVSPKAERRGIGTALLEAQKEIAQKLNLKYLVLGSRAPGFHAYKGSIQQYLKEKNANQESIDPLIRFYERAGLKIIKIVPNYMEDDPESRNYGAIMLCNL